MHPEMTDEDIARVAEVVDAYALTLRESAA
jgi:hypothetical protein